MADPIKTVKYFGFGTNKDLEMMAHMVGRDNLIGEPGKLLGYELCIQKIEHIRNIVPPNSLWPVPPQQIIRENYGDTFDLYVVKPKEGAETYGTIWDLTEEEMELVREWEMVDLGMQEDAEAMAMNNQGEIIPVKIQALLKEPAEVDEVIADKNYEPYIVPKEKILQKADQVRLNYLQRKNNPQA